MTLLSGLWRARHAQSAPEISQQADLVPAATGCRHGSDRNAVRQPGGRIPLDLLVVLLGVGGAFHLKARNRAKYESAGRLINEGL